MTSAEPRPPAATTRERLLRASIGILGADGARSLSLRAAEAAAGVPHGSARYHFGGYEGLLDAVLEEIVRLDELAMPTEMPAEADEVPKVLADVLLRWLAEDRSRLLARYELMLMAARDPRLQKQLTAATQRFHAVIRPLVADEKSVPGVVGLLDGILFDAVTRGSATPGQMKWAVRRVLRGVA